VHLGQLWIERAGDTHLLSVLIDDSTETSMVELLLNQIGRWGNVDIQLNWKESENRIRLLINISPGGASSLKCAKIDLCHCDAAIVHKVAAKFTTSHTLRQLSLINRCLPPSVFAIGSQLLEITLFHVSMGDCVRLLPQCVQAKHVTLQLYNGSLLAPTVTLPQIHSLDIWCTGRLDRILWHFTLPSLRSIGVHRYEGYNELGVLQALPNFLARSSCRLETLLIDDRRIFAHHILGLLSLPCLQSLRELIILWPVVTDRVVEALGRNTTGTSEVNLLPCLESFAIGSCSTTDGVISEMIASRCGLGQASEHVPASPLKKIYIGLRTSHGSLGSSVPHYPHSLCPPMHLQDERRFYEFEVRGVCRVYRNCDSMYCK